MDLVARLLMEGRKVGADLKRVSSWGLKSSGLMGLSAIKALISKRLLDETQVLKTGLSQEVFYHSCEFKN